MPVNRASDICGQEQHSTRLNSNDKAMPPATEDVSDVSDASDAIQR